MVVLNEGDVYAGLAMLSRGLPPSLDSSEADNLLRLAGVEDLRTTISQIRTSSALETDRLDDALIDAVRLHVCRSLAERRALSSSE